MFVYTRIKNLYEYAARMIILFTAYLEPTSERVKNLYKSSLPDNALFVFYRTPYLSNSLKYIMIIYLKRDRLYIYLCIPYIISNNAPQICVV